MKFDEKAVMSFLIDLAQAAVAVAFLTSWVICCAMVALLLRIDATVMADLPGEKESLGNKSLNGSGFVHRHYKKQLLRSKNFLTQIPEALGI